MRSEMNRPILACAALLFVACGSSTSSPDAAGGGGVDAATTTPDAPTTPPDAPTAPDTWTNYAKGFVDMFCVHCHSPGQSGYRMGQLDFRSYDIVKANAAEIRCGTAATLLPGCSGFPPPKQFPIAAP